MPKLSQISGYKLHFKSNMVSDKLMKPCESIYVLQKIWSVEIWHTGPLSKASEPTDTNKLYECKKSINQ